MVIRHRFQSFKSYMYFVKFMLVPKIVSIFKKFKDYLIYHITECVLCLYFAIVTVVTGKILFAVMQILLRKMGKRGLLLKRKVAYKYSVYMHNAYL